jgi:hypothetical protein
VQNYTIFQIGKAFFQISEEMSQIEEKKIRNLSLRQSCGFLGHCNLCAVCQKLFCNFAVSLSSGSVQWTSAESDETSQKCQKGVPFIYMNLYETVS